MNPTPNPHESRAQEMLRNLGPLETFQRLIAGNDRKILGAGLDNGREIVAERTAVHDVLVACRAEKQQAAFGYLKTLRAFRQAPADPDLSLQHAGYAPEDQLIIRDFGEDFFSGLYQRHANRFGSHLVRLARNDCSEPKAAVLRDGASLILGVVARDFPGLASCIGGALWKLGIGLRQVHCFSATNHHLALDFFHLVPAGNALPKDLASMVEDAVCGQLHLGESDEAALPRLGGAMDLQESGPGEFRLRYHDDQSRNGPIYTLCLRLFRHLQADIHGLSADVTRSGSFITIHHSLPPAVTLEQARRLIEERF